MSRLVSQAQRTLQRLPGRCALGDVLSEFTSNPASFVRPFAEFRGLRVVGQGSFGQVLLGQDGAGRPVAIKRGLSGGRKKRGEEEEDPIDVINEFFVPLAVERVWAQRGGRPDDCPSIRMVAITLDWTKGSWGMSGGTGKPAIVMEALGGTFEKYGNSSEADALVCTRRILQACMCLRDITPSGSFHCDIKTFNAGFRDPARPFETAVLFDYGGTRKMGLDERADFTIVTPECASDKGGTASKRGLDMLNSTRSGPCACDERMATYLVAYLALSLVADAFRRLFLDGSCGVSVAMLTSPEHYRGIQRVLGADGRRPSEACPLPPSASRAFRDFVDAFLVRRTDRTFDELARSEWMSAGGWVPFPRAARPPPRPAIIPSAPRPAGPVRIPDAGELTGDAAIAFWSDVAQRPGVTGTPTAAALEGMLDWYIDPRRLRRGLAIDRGANGAVFEAELAGAGPVALKVPYRPGQSLRDAVFEVAGIKAVFGLMRGGAGPPALPVVHGWTLLRTDRVAQGANGAVAEGAGPYVVAVLMELLETRRMFNPRMGGAESKAVNLEGAIVRWNPALELGPGRPVEGSVSAREEWAVRLLRHLLPTVAAMGDAGFAHCDIKPMNVAFRAGRGYAPEAALLIDVGGAVFGAASGSAAAFEGDGPDGEQTYVTPRCAAALAAEVGRRPSLTPADLRRERRNVQACFCTTESDVATLVLMAARVVNSREPGSFKPRLGEMQCRHSVADLAHRRPLLGIRGDGAADPRQAACDLGVRGACSGSVRSRGSTCLPPGTSDRFRELVLFAAEGSRPLRPEALMEFLSRW